MRFASLLFFTALLIAACGGSTAGTGGGGSSGVAVDADALCNKYVTDCHQATITLDDCKKTYVAVRVSQSCADAIKNATCTDLTSATSSTLDTCFPTCTTSGSQTCNGDGTVTTCSSSTHTYVFDCASLCSSVLNGTYTGTCGTTFEGQTSEKPKCWCK